MLEPLDLQSEQLTFTRAGLTLSAHLDHPAMQSSLEDLSNMWAARFGDRWVKETELRDDLFWEIAAKRLAAKDFLEDYDLVPEYQSVYRLCK
jgi:hypothetical protein